MSPEDRLLREYIAEEVHRSIAGSHPSEAYYADLYDDPAFGERSVYVPDGVKEKIRKWMKAMGLTSKRRARSA